MSITIALILVAWLPLCSVSLSSKNFSAMHYKIMMAIGIIQTGVAIGLRLNA